MTINGSGFTDVTCGPIAATSFTVVSDIAAVSPAEADAHYIVIDPPGGVAANNPADLCTFQGPAVAPTTPR